MLPSGGRLYFSDNGITSSTGEAVQLVRDAAGRVTSIDRAGRNARVIPMTRRATWSSVHNTLTRETSRYGYAADDPHLLILATAPTPQVGDAIVYGATTQAHPLTGGSGRTRKLPCRSAPRNTDGRATPIVSRSRCGRSSSQSTRNNTILLGVEVTAGAGSTLQPGVPTIAGLTPLLQRSEGGTSFALFSVDRDGLQLLDVTGRDAGTAGAYSLHVFVAGDANQDANVDGLDSAIVTQALGSSRRAVGLLGCSRC